MSWLEQTQILEELNRNLLELATALVEQLKEASVIDKDSLKDLLGIIREVRANIKTAHDIQLMAKQLDELSIAGEDVEDISLDMVQNGNPIVIDDDDDDEPEEKALRYLEEEEEDEGI